MAYAVVFYFEKKSEDPIRKIWKNLDHVGISPNKFKGKIRPHMTLAIYDSINCGECENEIKRFGRESNILSVQVNHFGVFPHQPAVVFIAPARNFELLKFHKEIHQILDGKAQGSWEMYKPNNWIPHCTLAQGIKSSELPNVFNICTKLKLPLKLRITQIGIVEFEPITPLFEVNLTKS